MWLFLVSLRLLCPRKGSKGLHVSQYYPKKFQCFKFHWIPDYRYGVVHRDQKWPHGTMVIRWPGGSIEGVYFMSRMAPYGGE